MKLNLGFNRKGNVTLDSTVILVVVLFITVVFPILFAVILPVFVGIAEATPQLASVANFIGENGNNLAKLLDTTALILLLGMFIAVIISSFLVDTHPVFFVVSLLGFMILLSSTVVLGNFGDDYIRSFTDIDVGLPITFFIATHILEIVLVSGFIISIVLYGKNRFRT